MELQKYHVWIFKGHSAINCPKEHLNPIYYFFWTTHLQTMYGFVSDFATRKANISFDITPKELKLSPGTKIHELFTAGVNHVENVPLSTQRRQNVNNAGREREDPGNEVAYSHLKSGS